MKITEELKERLRSIDYPPQSGHHYYGGRHLQLQPVQFNQDGIEMIGLNRDIYYLDKYERPACVGALIARLSLLASASDIYHAHRTNYASVITVLADAAQTSELRRLTPAQKKKVAEWVYSCCEAFGRNQHETASLILDILGGSQSATYHCPKPFEPRIGAMGSTTKMLRRAVQLFQALGAYKNHDPDVLVAHVLIDAGVDREKVELITHIRAFTSLVLLDVAVESARAWLHGVAEALYATDHEANKHTWDLGELAQQCKDPDKPQWSTPVFGVNMRSVSYTLNYIADKFPVLDCPAEPLEAVIPVIMTDAARFIKRHSANHG